MATASLLRCLRRRLGPSIAAALLAACGGGGGVDSGGTGASIQSFANGPITGFGSVIVTGVHFDEKGATVQDADGNARRPEELRLGTVLAVRGSAIAPDADGNDAAAATSIVIVSELVGPVGANDSAARTLKVFGETVDVTASTAFDDTLVGGQAALGVGDIVEVYGSLDAATGHHVATRVERKSAGTPFVLRGLVSSLDAVARTFMLGATRIDYAALGASSAPANGAFTRVVLAPTPAPGPLWTALRSGAGAPLVDDHEQAKLEGRIVAYTSNVQFSVDGTPVDARDAQFPDGTAGLVLGARVKVEGSTAGGVLVATRVDVVTDAQDSGKQFDVRGSVTSVDAAAKTFVVRSVVVSYAGNVDFRKGAASDLAIGRQVEARGTLSADGTRLDATRIDFKD